MELITAQEAAARANVTVKAIYYALTEGKLTRHEQYGRVLVDAAELAAYQPRAYGDRPSRRKPVTPAQQTRSPRAGRHGEEVSIRE